MIHRKKEHGKVKECQQFLSNGNCHYGNNCWWSHDNEVDMNTSRDNTEDNDNNMDTSNYAPQGFWETPEYPAPPSRPKPTKPLHKRLLPQVQVPNMIKNLNKDDLIKHMMNVMNQCIMNLQEMN